MSSTVGHWKDIQFCEVHWYRRSGKHKDRIISDATGRPYVIGDWSWNRMHHDRQETIEPRMAKDRVYG